jgi:HEAT repeat protein
MMTLMAVEWMKGALASPYARVEIAAALAARPEPATRQPALRWLELAVRQPDRAEAAGPALTAAGGKVCPLVKTDLAADDVSTRARAALALRDAGEADCRAGLLALARSPKAAAQARARAVAALAAYGDPESRAVVTAALAGGDATLRTGALSGLGRSRAGSARAPSLGAALRDPTAEVRAAAAAAAVRIGGGEALAALPIILQDPDPRPARAAAEEMAGLPGEDPSGVLVRLLERPEPEVREAAAHALVTRGEQTAYGALRPLLADGSPPRLRALALVAAEGPTLTQLARDSRLARAVYRAYLARGERDQAADCLLSHINVLPRPDQDALMLEWLGARPRPAPAGTAEPEPEPTAAR